MSDYYGFNEQIMNRDSMSENQARQLLFVLSKKFQLDFIDRIDERSNEGSYRSLGSVRSIMGLQVVYHVEQEPKQNQQIVSDDALDCNQPAKNLENDFKAVNEAVNDKNV